MFVISDFWESEVNITVKRGKWILVGIITPMLL